MKVDWYTDFYFPFLARWSKMVHGITGEHKFIFAEAVPNEVCTPMHVFGFQMPSS